VYEKCSVYDPTSSAGYCIHNRLISIMNTWVIAIMQEVVEDALADGKEQLVVVLKEEHASA